jgi:hypothetical protein
MEKSALAGDGRGCTPTPLQPFTIMFKVAVYRYAPAERSDTLPVFHLYPILYVLSGVPCTVQTGNMNEGRGKVCMTVR